jgi:hypothetical protein
MKLDNFFNSLHTMIRKLRPEITRDRLGIAHLDGLCVASWYVNNRWPDAEWENQYSAVKSITPDKKDQEQILNYRYDRLMDPNVETELVTA